MAEPCELAIMRVGAQGDGVAQTTAGPVFVPFTLAGETVRAGVEGERGRLIEVLQPSPDRIAPVCRHFGSCGGCSLQHMSAGVYRAWKRDQVFAAFEARGIDAPVRDLVTAPGLRRRATLAARRTSAGVLLGFHEMGSHEIVDLAECPVCEPRIVTAFGALKALVAPLLSRRGEMRITVTSSDGGLDVALDASARDLTPEIRGHLAREAECGEFARISLASDPVVERHPPFLRFGAADVVPPPGVFLQAVASAEQNMAVLIAAALGKSKSVADLFCGCGAFTFRLAEKARVFAFDSDKAAVAALSSAVRMTQGLKPIEARVRDLFREPLSPLELNEAEAVVFDPPRAGAEAQSRSIARARVKTVVGVSCNPATLARDIRILIDGGYKLESVTPIDQFHYSPHVEAVAVLRR